MQTTLAHPPRERLHGLDAEYFTEATVINLALPAKQHFHVPQALLY